MRKNMWYIILGLIATIYVLINLVLPSFIDGFVGSYVIRPLLWISLSVVTIVLARQEGLNIWNFKKIRRWEIGRTPFETALLIGGFQVSITILAGLLLGFGESPYSHTPIAIVINLVYVIPLLFGIELSRAYLIKKGTTVRRNITLAIGLVTLLFVIINIAPADFTILSFSNPAEAVKFLGETLVPLLAMGLLASYLAYLGGALPAIGYLGILQGFEWFSPILPNLDWALKALLGTLVPAIGFLMIQNSIQPTHGRPMGRTMRKKMKDPAINWTGVAVVSLLIVFFSFGYLGVQPTVILSGSMQPAIDVGDVVLLSKVPVDTIQKGDIIEYRNDNVSIVHRVYDIYKEGNTQQFITKGDANDNPDPDPISPQQIMGKAIFTLPKIGWIPITLKEFIKKIGVSVK